MNDPRAAIAEAADPDLDRHAGEPPPVGMARAGGFGPLGLVRAGRRNLLAMWPAGGYRAQTMSFRLLRQAYFVCNSPDTVRRVFLDAHDNYDRKSPQMRHALAPLLGDGLFVSDGALWRERRAHCAPAFEPDLLPGFAAVMTAQARALAADWASQPQDQPRAMLEDMARLTARIIGRALFGDDTSDDEAMRVVRGFAAYQAEIEQLGLADMFGIRALRWIADPWRRRRARAAAAEVQAVIDRIIARHRPGRPGAPPTLLSLMLDPPDGADGAGAAGPRCPLGAEAARNEAIVMFMAGHETTANALAWTWYLLDHSPRAAAMLHAELDSVLGDRPPDLADLPRLPYTRAVFEEAMRLYPPVPLLSRQARAADQIRARDVAPDAIILVVPWLLHRHTLYWRHPEHFIPERFLPHRPRPDKYVYLPFSVGRRVCLGLRFGLTEGLLCLATLAQRFRARVAPGHSVGVECRLTLRPRDGLPMLIAPRRAPG